MGRPRQNIEYDRAKVKRLNERFRKLEKVYKKADSSVAYQTALHYATGTSQSKFWNVKFNEVHSDEVQLRMLNKTDFEKLSDADKQRFNEVLDNLLNAKTTTKIGMEEVESKSYRSFLKNHDLSEDQLSFQKYQQLMTYKDRYNKQHFEKYIGSDEINELFGYIAETEDMTEWTLKDFRNRIVGIAEGNYAYNMDRQKRNRDFITNNGYKVYDI